MEDPPPGLGRFARPNQRRVAAEPGHCRTDVEILGDEHPEQATAPVVDHLRPGEPRPEQRAVGRLDRDPPDRAVAPREGFAEYEPVEDDIADIALPAASRDAARGLYQIANGQVTYIECRTLVEDEAVLDPLARELGAVPGLVPEPRTKLERALALIGER